MQQGVFQFACALAVPNALLAAALKALDVYGPDGVNNFLPGVLSENAFGSFTFLIGLFIAFRASQAYGRFWDGTDSSFQMVAGFFDVVSSVCSFCRFSKRDKNVVTEYKHTLVRLFSLLHALILAELEAQGKIAGTETALDLDVIDLEGLDAKSRVLLRESEEKVDLVFHWIQVVIVQGHHSEIVNVAPPILTRVFQELNTCMIQFHQALKITEVPIPFPYTAATEVMLIIHWLLTPLVTGTWTEHILASAIFSFVQVFMVWSLNSLTEELENPFGNDENDLNRYAMHMELNSRLLMLLQDRAEHVPCLSENVCKDPELIMSCYCPVKEIYANFDFEAGKLSGPTRQYRAVRKVEMREMVTSISSKGSRRRGSGLRRGGTSEVERSSSVSGSVALLSRGATSSVSGSEDLEEARRAQSAPRLVAAHSAEDPEPPELPCDGEADAQLQPACREALVRIIEEDPEREEAHSRSAGCLSAPSPCVQIKTQRGVI